MLDEKEQRLKRRKYAGQPSHGERAYGPTGRIPVRRGDECGEGLSPNCACNLAKSLWANDALSAGTWAAMIVQARIKFPNSGSTFGAPSWRVCLSTLQNSLVLRRIRTWV